MAKRYGIYVIGTKVKFLAWTGRETQQGNKYLNGIHG